VHHPGGPLVRGQPDRRPGWQPQHRVERGQAQVAPRRRVAGHHQQAVIPAGTQAADGAHGVPAPPVGDQPLPRGAGGQVAADLRAEPDLLCAHATHPAAYAPGMSPACDNRGVTKRGTGAERARLAAADAGQEPWRAWGPYLAERAWGTVREHSGGHAPASHYFPHDHARCRTYRWNEDGMAGVCDEWQTFCFALALWNGQDPILKERMFGLSSGGGNHGEDAKEYWW